MRRPGPPAPAPPAARRARRPWTATVSPHRPAVVPSRPDRVEGVRIAEVVPERDDRPGLVTGDQALDRLPLATGIAGPHVDHGTPAIRPQAVVGETEPGFDRGDRVEDGRPGHRDVVGLADVERDRRALALDEEPGRPAELLGDARRQGLGRDAVGLEAGLDDGGDGVGRPASIEPRRLQAVIAQVLDAADPGPGRDVRDGPPGEDGHVQPARPRGGDPGQTPECAPGAGIDAGGRRIA